MPQRDPIRCQGDLVIDVETAPPGDYPQQFYSSGFGTPFQVGTGGDFVVRTGEQERGRITANGNTTGVFAGLGGGSSSPLTTKGDLYGFDTAGNRIPIGTNGQVLTVDDTQPLGVKWGSAAAASLSSVLAVGSDAGASRITNLGAPSGGSDAATKTYVDNAPARSLSSVLAVGADAGGHAITNAGAPSAETDLSTKGYVDCATFNNQAASYTAVFSDIGKVVNFTGSSAATLTIPTNATANWASLSPLLPVIYVCQGGVGQVTIAGAAGVTIVNPFSSFTTAGRYAEVKLTWIGGDTWRLNGEVT